MKHLLLVTTEADNSSRLFVEAGKLLDCTVRIIHYDQRESSTLKDEEQFDIVYFRDPFNTGIYSEQNIKAVIETVVAHSPHAYYVDGIESLKGVLEEDKWHQYKKYSDFIPPTQLFVTAKSFIRGKHIIKKRISSRARDVHFDIKPDFLNGNYILQERMAIAKEYRVFVVNDDVLDTVLLRSSKTPRTKVKITAAEPLPRGLYEFVSRIVPLCETIDLGGLDIIKTTDGSYRLLELNRSCQFDAYLQFTGVNIAEELLRGLLNEWPKSHKSQLR